MVEPVRCAGVVVTGLGGGEVSFGAGTAAGRAFFAAPVGSSVEHAGRRLVVADAWFDVPADDPGAAVCRKHLVPAADWPPRRASQGGGRP